MDSLGEDLMLLAIDPANGVMHGREHLRYGLMGAELIALAGLCRIEISDGRIVVTDATPTGDPELDAALAGL